MKREVKKYEKKIFIGTERICHQVAYVLDIKEYVTKESLTSQNYEEYKDGKIYVCEFKKKSKSIVDKSIRNNKDIKYLNDICRQIDKEHFTNRRRHKKGLRRQLGSWWRYIKFLCRKYMKIIYYRSMQIFRGGVKYSLNKKLLYCLNASKLFLYVMNAPVNSNVKCSRIESEILIDKRGFMSCCCSLVVPFGNLLYDGELDEIYNSIYARIIKLSSINKSYCLCDFNNWCPSIVLNQSQKSSHASVSDKSHTIQIAIDPTCNLCCKSCRNKHYIMHQKNRIKVNIITNKLIRSGYMDKAEELIMATQGEVFYSPYYRQLLETGLQRESIRIISNGTLFNESNWNWLKDKYKIIDVEISVDAAMAETYKKLRGGNFEKLMENLEMLGSLRRQGKIRSFNLNFVVQRDNFHEMVRFVKIAKGLGVDSVNFQRMVNFGNLAHKEFLNKCLIVDNQFLDRELWEVLQGPIFKDSIVDLRSFHPYIEASNLRYGTQIKNL